MLASGRSLNARLISSRSAGGRRAVSRWRSARRPGRSLPARPSSCWLQVALGVVVLGEDEDCACRSTWPAAGAEDPAWQVRAHVAADPVDQVRTRASGSALAASAISRHLVEQPILFRMPGRPTAVGERGRLDLGVFLGLNSSCSGACPVVVAVDALDEQIDSAGSARLPRPTSLPPCFVRRCAGERGACERTPRRRRASAVASRRSAGRRWPACVWLSPCSRSSRSRRYWSRSTDRRKSGASSGRPSRSICRTMRCGKPPIDGSSRRSSLRRRTITSSRSFLLLTGTPRQKRCGSRISSRAEKLLEWPLCGVADRKRRCSNRGARSRTARVIFESMA